MSSFALAVAGAVATVASGEGGLTPPEGFAFVIKPDSYIAKTVEGAYVIKEIE